MDWKKLRLVAILLPILLVAVAWPVSAAKPPRPTTTTVAPTTTIAPTTTTIAPTTTTIAPTTTTTAPSSGISLRGTPASTVDATGIVTVKSFTTPAAAVVSDALVAVLNYKTPTASDIANTAPSGWTKVAGELPDCSTSTCTHLVVATKAATGGAEAPLWSFASAPAGLVITVTAYANVDTAVPFDKSGYKVEAGGSSTTTHTAPSFTPSVSDSWGFAAFGTRASETWTPGAGLVERSDVRAATTNQATLEIDDSNGVLAAGVAKSYSATEPVGTSVAIGFAGNLRLAATVPTTTTLAPTTTEAPTTTVAPTTTTTAPGSDMPIGNLPGWQQIKTEDFAVDAATGTWSTPCDASHIDYVGATGTQWRSYPQCYNDTNGRPYRGDQVLSVHDGLLDFFLHPVNGIAAGANPSPVIDNATGSQYQTYGRYSMKMRLDSTGMTDYKTAILLWPTGADESHWCEAESDYPEASLISTTVSAFHHNGCPSSQDAFTTPTFDRTTWHVFTQEWGPGFRKYYFDSTLIGTSTANVWAGPERWQLQVETRSAITNDNQGHLLIDWAVVYSYCPSCT